MRYLLTQGADREIKTDDGETALELVEEDDFKTLAILMNTEIEKEKERRLSVWKEGQEKKEPAWVRRESVQEALRKESLQETDTRRKGSAWIGKSEIPEEEETEEVEEQTSDKIKVDPATPAVVGSRQRRNGRLELPSIGNETFTVSDLKER